MLNTDLELRYQLCYIVSNTNTSLPKIHQIMPYLHKCTYNLGYYQ